MVIYVLCFLLASRLSEFLYDDLDIQSYTNKNLPTDDFSLEQSCLLTSEHATWCLICDPIAKTIDWLSKYHESNLVVVQYNVSSNLGAGRINQKVITCNYTHNGRLPVLITVVLSSVSLFRCAGISRDNLFFSGSSCTV